MITIQNLFLPRIFKWEGVPADALPNAAVYPPFWVYVNTATTLKVTGGTFIHPNLGVFIAVGLSDDLTPADGDKVWLERVHDYTTADPWQFNYGADWPTDKLFFELFDGVDVSGGNVSLNEDNRIWKGGDIIWPEVFPVTLSQTGGSAGDKDTECSFSYTATTLGGIEVATSIEPENSRARIVNAACTAGTLGTCYIDADGELHLWDCNERLQQSNCPEPGSGV